MPQGVYQVLGCQDKEALSSLSSCYIKQLPQLDPNVKADIFTSLWLTPSIMVDNATQDRLIDTYQSQIFTADPEDISSTEQRMTTWLHSKIGNYPIVAEYDGSDFNYYAILDFDAPWNKAFNEKKTSKKFFHSPTEAFKIDMMQQKECMDYSRCEQFTAVGKTFAGGAFEAVFVVPNEGYDINDVINDGHLKLIDKPDFFDSRLVNLEMPRFHIWGNNNLYTALSACGVEDIDGVDFNAENSNLNQFIDFNVDEEGAKVIVIGGIIDVIDVLAENEVVIDRPFAVIIREVNTHACIIAAKIADPREKEIVL